jgi:hypothetical protein
MTEHAQQLGLGELGLLEKLGSLQDLDEASAAGCAAARERDRSVGFVTEIDERTPLARVDPALFSKHVPFETYDRHIV